MKNFAIASTVTLSSLLAGTQVFAGDPTGANTHIDRVQAGVTDVYEILMAGGEPALISISGDGDTDLDLYVFDEFGNQVCSSTSYGDDESCRFYPRWTGAFTVEVANLGTVYNEYLIRTN